MQGIQEASHITIRKSASFRIRLMTDSRKRPPAWGKRDPLEVEAMYVLSIYDLSHEPRAAASRTELDVPKRMRSKLCRQSATACDCIWRKLDRSTRHKCVR